MTVWIFLEWSPETLSFINDGTPIVGFKLAYPVKKLESKAVNLPARHYVAAILDRLGLAFGLGAIWAG